MPFWCTFDLLRNLYRYLSNYRYIELPYRHIVVVADIVSQMKSCYWLSHRYRLQDVAKKMHGVFFVKIERQIILSETPMRFRFILTLKKISRSHFIANILCFIVETSCTLSIAEAPFVH